jgi:hypothetical protein
MTFRVGQKVVCIYSLFPKHSLRGHWQQFWHPYVSPVNQQIYTIANIYMAGDELCLELLEMPSPATDVWCAGFLACGFRPVVARDTDISFAHEILRKTSKRMPARSSA